MGIYLPLVILEGVIVKAMSDIIKTLSTTNMCLLR